MTTLSHLLSLHAAATPGTWQHSFAHWGMCSIEVMRPDLPSSDDEGNPIGSLINGVRHDNIVTNPDGCLLPANAAAIVALHNAFPALAQECEMNRMMASEAQTHVGRMQAMFDLQVSLTNIATEALARRNAECDALRAEVARLKAVIQEDAAYTAHRPGAK